MFYERIKLEADEKVLRLVRKHWWIPFVGVTITVCSALAPLFLMLVFRLVLVEIPDLATQLIPFLNTYQVELWFGYLLWLTFHWMALANIWTHQYLDLWAITNRRVVAIEQHGFFHRFLSSFRLERLQDMNISVKGVIPTLLNFGTIEAQTAGASNEEFKATNMPDPRGLKVLIIRHADERQHALSGTQALKADGTL